MSASLHSLIHAHVILPEVLVNHYLNIILFAIQRLIILRARRRMKKATDAAFVQ